MQKFIPDYEYLIYDISRYTDEEIKGQAQLRIILTIFRAVEYLQELEDKQKGIEYFETFIRYIFNARANLTKKDVREIINKISKTYSEGSELVMTLAEIFRQEGKEEGIKQGIEKGIEKGIQQGERRKSLNYAIKLLTKKFGKLPEELKTKISNLDTVTLEVIIGDILDYKSLEDVKKYIR
ncbi:DUF4351 domain-containing protein [Coprococcus sp. MSK.21.13]|nr:DUF4351 domain-containing protein [Coprococcus sp. MSK.21.13]